LYTSSDTNITDDFPPDTSGGVSSAIVWPNGMWSAHDEINYKGASIDMKSGYYANPGDIAIGGDHMASVQQKH
jgi:hypothetical protein